MINKKNKNKMNPQVAKIEMKESGYDVNISLYPRKEGAPCSPRI
jgi:hypothetical protein